ncbi:hypothetical protein BS50DRAFT_643036 [Corynespora cassiicola Philippines]|uniref:Uncharacterized protein n=1 Tax=Corynespora cassiicola Philippines TaxID=1448308 RepID=A0A2T2PAD0_CORCC|nr:hypothetical protein BS50DRAFT_643036 [Corynespora cassiicola Philippines]
MIFVRRPRGFRSTTLIIWLQGCTGKISSTRPYSHPRRQGTACCTSNWPPSHHTQLPAHAAHAAHQQRCPPGACGTLGHTVLLLHHGRPRKSGNEPPPCRDKQLLRPARYIESALHGNPPSSPLPGPAPRRATPSETGLGGLDDACIIPLPSSCSPCENCTRVRGPPPTAHQVVSYAAPLALRAALSARSPPLDALDAPDVLGVLDVLDVLDVLNVLFRLTLSAQSAAAQPRKTRKGLEGQWGGGLSQQSPSSARLCRRRWAATRTHLQTAPRSIRAH